MMRRIESIHRNERYKHMWTETNRREEEEEKKTETEINQIK